jgi:hypothetical protein
VVRLPHALKQRQSKVGALVEAFTDSNLPIFVQIFDWASIPSEFQAEMGANDLVVQQPDHKIESALNQIGSRLKIN